jgi:RNA polymerase sigma-70 factor (ECF subfamily)
MSTELAYLAQRLERPFEPRLVTRAPHEHERFERLVERHDARLRRVAAGVLDDVDRIDDVLQEAYLKAYRRLPRQFANEAHEATWLYRVVFRCCLDELRHARRRPRRAAEVERLPVAAHDGPGAPAVMRAFRQLGLQDRSVLVLVELLGLDYDTAARVLGLRRGTVASRLSRARERFRAALLEEGVDVAGR